MLATIAATLLGAAPCTVGVHVISLSQINIADRSAFVDFYWWVNCPKDAPADAFALAFISASQHEVIDTYREDVGEVTYQSQRVRGQLRVPLSLKRYPFDRQRLVIDLESQLPVADQRYELDKHDEALFAAPRCCLDREVSLPDWRIDSATASLESHEYATQFGYPGPHVAAERQFDRLRVEVLVHREVVPYVIKYLLPLLVILGVAFARCFWGADQLDASTAVVATSLLAVVALHLAHATGLPEVGYLVTGDLFFLHSELVLVLMLVMTVIEHRFAASRAELAERLLAWERRLIPLIVLGGWGAIIALAA